MVPFDTEEIPIEKKLASHATLTTDTPLMNLSRPPTKPSTKSRTAVATKCVSPRSNLFPLVCLNENFIRTPDDRAGNESITMPNEETNLTGDIEDSYWASSVMAWLMS